MMCAHSLKTVRQAGVGRPVGGSSVRSPEWKAVDAAGMDALNDSPYFWGIVTEIYMKLLTYDINKSTMWM